jgi:N-acyl homoserine lactone hydrolase
MYLPTGRPLGLAIAAAVAVVCAAHIKTAAQSSGRSTQTVRLYVFDCGVLHIADPMPLFGLKKTEVATTDLADAAYLIVHPRGTLMWEAGLVPDANIGSVNARPGAPDKRLMDQLVELGYPPSSINFFAISHGHGDHTANANAFAASTWLVNKAEYDEMFADKPPRFYTPSTYGALRNSTKKYIDGDYDVFGDGAVVIKQTPGHTPGHQILALKLATTGVVVLTGDLYHYPEEVGRREVAPAQGNQEVTLASRDALQAFLKKTNGQMWMTHDLSSFSKLKKAPSFYE